MEPHISKVGFMTIVSTMLCPGPQWLSISQPIGSQSCLAHDKNINIIKALGFKYQQLSN